MIDDTTVIDFHGHVGRWDVFEMNDDPDEIVHAMDRGGIDRSCLFAIFHPDGTTGNDRTAAFVAQHPDRFIGFAYVSPLYPESMVPELERAVDTLDFRAIKIYPPYVPWPLDEPIWEPIYRFAHDRRLAVITHTGSEDSCWPVLVGKVAERFPDANFVIGHSGNAEPYRTQAIEAAQRHENVYLETCSTFREPDVIERLVNEAGADRVLFGSDVPLMDPRTQLGKIITADLTDEQKRLVLGANASKLLKLEEG